LDLSIPIPKAIVAHITRTSSRMNASCRLPRVAESSPAWYASAGIPAVHSASASFSVLARLPAYTIPASSSGRARSHFTSASTVRGECSTRYRRFARSNEATCTAGRRNPSCATTSSRTRAVAVAVNAQNGTSGKRSRNGAMRRYSGRKSWPHSLMQCASSTTKRATSQRSRSPEKPGSVSRSGATYSSL
jgi:hypothetical protein